MAKLKESLELFNYDIWANRRVLEAIRGLTKGRGRSLQLMSHIIQAQNLWYQRSNGFTKSLKDVWNDWDLETCHIEMERVHQLWSEFLTEDKLKSEVLYKNLKGKSFTNRVGEIVSHVINHSTYHRGQVVAEIRKAGGEPPETDLIIYFRE